MARNPEAVVRKANEQAGAALERLDVDAAYSGLAPAGDRHRQAEAAIRLRFAGATYSEIAEVLEYPTATLAREAVERLLAATVGEEDREQARYMSGQRLMRVMRSLYPNATDADPEKNPDHLGYAKVYLAFVDRYIRLYGLDAPSEVNVSYAPRQEEFNRAIEQALSEIRGQFPEEADILDAEVVEGEEEGA